MDRNVERRFEMGKDKLAAVAAEDVLFPEVAFFRRECAIMVGREHFGIGTEFDGRSGRRPDRGTGARDGRRGGTQMAGERFFKGPVAVVRRHSVLLS
jgi:hypothetical protein